MNRQKCSSCGKEAFAYKLETDGSKTYLCEWHLPQEEAPEHPDVYARRNPRNTPKPDPR